MAIDLSKLPQLFRFCPICTTELTLNPNYKRAGAKTCSTCGDFFVGRGAGKEPLVIFKPFVKHPRGFQRHRWNHGRPGALIRCEQTGQLFATIKQAADILKIHPTNLSAHLKGDKRALHVGGYTFKVVDPNV